MLPDFEEPDDLGNVIIEEASGRDRRDCQAHHPLKALIHEMINNKYTPSKGTHVFTDRSSGVVKNTQYMDGGLTQQERSQTLEQSQQHYTL